LVINEWRGSGSVFSLDDPAHPRSMSFSDRTWPMPWITADPPSRRAYVTSMLADGSLRELDLDTLEPVRQRSGVFVYQSVVDPARGILWGTRPVHGELVGIDTATLAIRVRVHLSPGTRDVVLDPESGQLFVNTYPAGALYRVDGASGRVLEEGACGFRCRSLYLDVPRRTLWSASLAGIRRFVITRPIAPPR
jgi:hypothetical protein